MLSSDPYICDAEIAERLRLKPGTIRKERYNRRHGLPHWFTVDPIMIGSMPRYKASEFEDCLAAQSKGRKAMNIPV
jgi:hypothetical protein